MIILVDIIRSIKILGSLLFREHFIAWSLLIAYKFIVKFNFFAYFNLFEVRIFYSFEKLEL